MEHPRGIGNRRSVQTMRGSVGLSHPLKTLAALLIALEHPPLRWQAAFVTNDLSKECTRQPARLPRRRSSRPFLGTGQLVAERHKIGEPLSLEAWVYRSRLIGRQLAFLTLGNGERGDDLLQAMFKMPGKSVKLYAPGSRVSVQGILEQNKKGDTVLAVHEVKLLRAAAAEYSIRRVLSAATTGLLTPAEAKAALLLDEDAELPNAADAIAIDSLQASLHKFAPPETVHVANGGFPQLPLAAKAPMLGDLFEDGGMQRAHAALLEAGGKAAAAAVLASEAPDRQLLGNLFVIDGEVCGRRRFSDGFCVVNLRVDSELSNSIVGKSDFQNFVLHESFSGETASMYANLTRVGAYVRFVGISFPADGASALVLVSGVQLRRSSPDLKFVRNLLDYITDGSMDALEGMLALPVEPENCRPMDAALSFREKLQAENPSERQWHASALQKALATKQAARQRGQEDCTDGSDERARSLGEADTAAAEYSALHAFESLRARYPRRHLQPDEQVGCSQVLADGLAKQVSALPTINVDRSELKTSTQHQSHWQPEPGSHGDNAKSDSSSAPVRRSARHPGITDGLRVARDGSFWQTKKRPQLLLMTQIVANLLSSNPKRDATVNILDIGGGRGHLAAHLAEQFGKRVNVTVVDINMLSISKGSMFAHERDNLHFLAGDASELARTGALGNVDIIVGLHACGGLSDVILGQAVAHGAAFAVATCCYLSHPHLKVQAGDGKFISRDEWLEASYSSSIAADAGINASLMQEGLQSALRAAEQQKDPVLLELGAHTVNAIRANAVEWYWTQRWQQHRSDNKSGRASPDEKAEMRHGPKQSLSVDIVSFERKYSQRNFVVVGTPCL